MEHSDLSRLEEFVRLMKQKAILYSINPSRDVVLVFIELCAELLAKRRAPSASD